MVSIILPTYNRAHLIKESIDSILQQTYTDFELIIADDGSDDNTQEIINNIDDKRIRYFRKEHTGHTGVLKNFALSIAKGDLIAFNDSDDLWTKEKLGWQVKLLNENKSIGFSISDVTTFRDDHILSDHSFKLRHTIENKNIFNSQCKGQIIIYPSTLVIRKTCFTKVGLFNESMLSGDYHFNMRLSYYYDACIIYEPLVLRRLHNANMSQSIPFENYAEYIETYEYLYRNKMIDTTILFKAKSNAFLKMSVIHSKNGDKKQAIGNFLTSIKYGIPTPLYFVRLWRSLNTGQRK